MTPAEATPARPTHVLYRCRRCDDLHMVESDDAEGKLIELVTTLRTLMTVRCSDGALAVAEVVGCGPGAWPPKVPERSASEVVITEKATRR